MVYTHTYTTRQSVIQHSNPDETIGAEKPRNEGNCDHTNQIARR